MSALQYLTNKIIVTRTLLAPTILKAILCLYLENHEVITANMVKARCMIIDNSVPWDRRIAAICNTMRNTTECGATIISDDRDHNDLTIKFFIIRYLRK